MAILRWGCTCILAPVCSPRLDWNCASPSILHGTAAALFNSVCQAHALRVLDKPLVMREAGKQSREGGDGQQRWGRLWSSVGWLEQGRCYCGQCWGRLGGEFHGHVWGECFRQRIWQKHTGHVKSSRTQQSPGADEVRGHWGGHIRWGTGRI